MGCPEPSWGLASRLSAHSKKARRFSRREILGIFIFEMSTTGVSLLRSTDVNASKNRHNLVSQEICSEIREFPEFHD